MLCSSTSLNCHEVAVKCRAAVSEVCELWIKSVDMSKCSGTSNRQRTQHRNELHRREGPPTLKLAATSEDREVVLLTDRSDASSIRIRSDLVSCRQR